MNKRILCIFLSLLFCLGCLPAAGAARGAGEVDVWSAIGALEREGLPAAPAPADYEALLPQVEALVTARDDCAPGSVSCRDGVLHWRNADGVAFSYDPQLRAAVRDAVPMPEEERAAAEREADRAAGTGETAVLMSGNSGSRDVAVFVPWWGEDKSFTLETCYQGIQLADAMGGSCKRYLAGEATIDALADALTTCRMVFVNTHGGVGNVTLLTDTGVTAQDYANGHVTSSGSGFWSVDGQAILNHVRGPVVTEYFSANSCLSMAGEGLEAPLRDSGVKVVLGYSQSVTFIYNFTFTRALISELLLGKTVAEAVDGAHRQIADYFLSNNISKNEKFNAMLEEKGAVYWDVWKGGTASTPEEAREKLAAFPIVVSEQDAYPGVAHKDEIQDVRCAWKVPLDETASAQLRDWGVVGRTFASYFPDAQKITLLDGSGPPGVETGVQQFLYSTVGSYSAAGFFGTPTKAGLYESRVSVTLGSGAVETRWARFVIAEEGITYSEEELTAQPGVDQTLWFFSGHSGEIFHAEQLNGTVPPGMTVFFDGGQPRLCGTPMQTGSFSAEFRIVLTTGRVIDHIVSVCVPDRYGVSSQTAAFFVGVNARTPLTFENSDMAGYMELVGGELPPGMSYGCSMSEAPNYHGTPLTEGTYHAVFRAVFPDGTALTHLVTAVVSDEAPYIPVYPMDLSRGSTIVSKAEMDTWLNRTFTSAVKVGQIRIKNNTDGGASLDVDKDGKWDIRFTVGPDGSATFSQEGGTSLTGEYYTFRLSSDAAVQAGALWESDHGARYAKEIEFHLSESYDLYIAGTRVTSRNRDDVLGDGVFSFDGVDTLSIHGDCEYSGTEPLIRNEISWLTVRTETDSSLSSWGNCIETYHAMTLTGTGQLSLNSSEHSGIVCDGALLEIFGMDLAVQAKERGIFGTGTVAVHTRMNHANVMIRSGQGALDGFWSIGMTNCMVTSPMRGEKGVIANRACLVDGDGTLLNDVRITAYEEEYGLVIDGIQVTDRNREDVLDNGIFSFDGDRTLTINGSYEEAVGTVIDSVIPLTVFAAPDTVLRTPKTTCLSFSRNTVITGGPLTAVSDSRFGRGVFIGQGSSLFLYETELDARGGRFGIQGAQATESESGGKLDVWASEVTASGPVAAVRVPGGLELEQSIIVSPEGGWFSDTDGQVCAAGGDAAPEVSISSFRTWELYVAGTQVTELNMEDVLGNGTFSFDGKHTLTVRGDCRSDRGIIESYVPGLVLLVEEDSVLETEEGADPIYAGADLTVTGPGKLSLVSPCTAAVIQRGGSVLTIRDADVAARGPYGLWGGSDDALVVENSTLTASGAEGAVLNFGKGVTLTGCEITSPAGAVIKDGAVVTSGGEVCGEVTIAPVIHVTGVSLSKTALTLAPGESAALKATVAPADAAVKGVTWSSSNTSVAAVSGSGRVTAKAEGTAVITVKTNDGGRTAKCTVTVKDPTVHVTGVTLDKVSLTLKVGESGTLKATVAPNNATDKGVTWSSSKTSVATVSSGGKVTAVAAGTAVITVKTKDGGKTSSCAVTVEEAAQEEEGAISVIGGVMVYSIALPESGGAARIVAAWYDENGTLLGCAVKDGVAQDGWKTGMINVDQGQKEYRLFALDSVSGKPLIRALTTRS